MYQTQTEFLICWKNLLVNSDIKNENTENPTRIKNHIEGQNAEKVYKKTMK